MKLLAGLLAGLAVALFAACGLLLLLTRDYERALYGGGGVVSGLACLAVGLLVARRRPGSPVGWLLLGWSLLIPLTGAALLYSVLDYRLRHGTLPFGPVAVAIEPADFGIAVLSALAVLLFPDGRLPSRRWRGLVAVFLAAAAVYLAWLFTGQIQALGRHPPLIGPSGAPVGTPLASPLASPAGFLAHLGLAHLGVVAGWVILGCWLAFGGRQAARYRGSSWHQRQQLKLLLAGAACCVLATAVTIVVGSYASGAAQAVQDVADLGAAALPAGLGVGIVRYRLYDIERIISRTLAYAIVTGLLVGVYAGLVLLATQVLRFSSPVAVAAATLAAAALFTPLRRRVQQAVDKRFNRARYDADQMIAAFAVRMQDAVNQEAAGDDLALVVQRALEPAHLRVYVRSVDAG